jgi:hypothetical protein
MHPRRSPDDQLLGLAEAQGGVLHHDQVVQLGLGRHSIARLTSGDGWQRLDRGLYLARPGEPSWLSWAWGGILLGGPDARLAGLSAAHLHGLTPDDAQPFDVLVPHARPIRSRPPWQFRRERPGVHERRSPGSPPRTTVEDTVLDLVERSTVDEALGWVTSAVQSRRTTVPRLRRALQRRGRIRHRRLLEELLADVAHGAESPLEVRYLRDVERAHNLPTGERQSRSSAGDVRDVLYRRYATVVELDGRLGHEGRGRFRDMRRDNAALLDGEVTLRYGDADLRRDPCAVAFQVAEVLVRRGWVGAPTRCRRCRLVPSRPVG